MIGNADQTPLTFDLPVSSTLELMGTKSVPIKTTGNEKNRFTVMLGCTADGTKLPPYIIFKRKTMPKEKFPKGVIVKVQEKGWMDEELTKDWIKTVWAKHGKQSRKMLVLDSFRAHRTPAIKKILQSAKTDLVIIPGGLTSILQPLDVVVNKPFKTKLTRRWNAWMMDKTLHSYTATGRQRRPELAAICQWIVDAWADIELATIQTGFKKCCISNAMDGSEDDVLWEEAGENVDPCDANESGDPGYYCDYDGVDFKLLEKILADTDDEEEFEGF